MLRRAAVLLCVCVCPLDIAAYGPPRLRVCRRALLASAIGLANVPLKSHAVTFSLSPAARVNKYPGLEYLEPIYELKRVCFSRKQHTHSVRTAPHRIGAAYCGYAPHRTQLSRAAAGC